MATNIKPDSKFNIGAFISEIKTRGVMRTQFFHVDIGVPKYMQNMYNLAEKDSISMRCEATALPGIDLADGFGGPRAGYGVKEYIPYNVEHKAINFTFILDQETRVHDFFMRWINCIVNYNNNYGTSLNSKVDHGGINFNTYEVGYKEDYASTMNVYTYNPNGDETFNVQLFQAFPISVSEVPMTWNDTDKIGRLTVPITFKSFKYQTNLSTT